VKLGALVALALALALASCGGPPAVPVDGPCGALALSAIGVDYLARVTADCQADRACPNFDKLTRERDARHERWIACSPH
jgi:hypothetical protein